MAYIYTWIEMVISYHAPFVSQFKMFLDEPKDEGTRYHSSPCRNINGFWQTNDSDVGFIMVIYSMRSFFFTILECLEEIEKCVKNNTVEKYFVLVWSDLHFKFSTLFSLYLMLWDVTISTLWLWPLKFHFHDCQKQDYFLLYWKFLNFSSLCVRAWLNNLLKDYSSTQKKVTAEYLSTLQLK